MKARVFPQAVLIYAAYCSLALNVARATPGLQQQIPPAEYAALVDLYTSTLGAGWSHNSGWNDPAAPAWEGVTVSGVQYNPATGEVLSLGTVTELRMDFNHMTGHLPASLGNLAHLQYLNFQANFLTGSIPDTLGNLSDLTTLHLDAYNSFTGTIPETFGNLTKLQTLDLSGNRLSGSIPASLGNLTDLQELALNANNLSGSIPESLGNLVNLRNLSFWNNKLSGTIPTSLGNLVNLLAIELSENCFDASIQAQVETIFATQIAAGSRVDYLPQNAECVGPGLKQRIPAAEYSTLLDLYTSTHGERWTENDGWTNPEAPWWYGVTVSGFEDHSTSGQILTVGTVTRLDLDANQLNGTLPDSLGDLENLERLQLSDNQLHGSIPAMVGNLVKLSFLALNGNQLDGSIPETLGNLTSLGLLELANNQLSGTLPESMGNLTGLARLVLDANHLTGRLPATFANFRSLGTFTISHNEFSGDLPDLPPMCGGLDISYNCFNVFPGSQVRTAIDRMPHSWGCAPRVFLPQSAGCVPGLQQQIPAAEYSALIDLFNSTHGEAWNPAPWLPRPEGWANPSAPFWTGVTVAGFQYDSETGDILSTGTVDSLELFYGGLSGPIPASIGNLTNLRSLQLYNNSLSGNIPSTIGQLSKLEQLYLGNNQLSGTLPASIGNLINLRNIWLPGNRLSGRIPASFDRLPNLVMLELSQNELSGTIPDLTSIASHGVALGLTDNCFDLSPGSPDSLMIAKLQMAGASVNYQPQNPNCFGPDLNRDGCIDRADLNLLMTQVRARSTDLRYDVNGDGKVDIADARALVLGFTHPDGSPCVP